MTPAPPVVFDIETGSAKTERWAGDPKGFVRIVGVQTPHGYGSFTGSMRYRAADLIGRSSMAIGHNVIGFDLPALNAAFPGSCDVLEMTRQRRVLDTQITEAVLDPPENDDRPNAVARAMAAYGLDATCERRGIPGKTADLDTLAFEFGTPSRSKTDREDSGYGRIPLDDPRFLAYLRGDIEATGALAKLQVPQLREYVWREHRVAAIAATMTEAGVGVDRALLDRRYWAVANRKSDLKRTLVARYGLPTVKADGKPSDSPQATKEGKSALVAAFLSLGVADGDLPRTPKQDYAFGGEPMAELAARYEGNGEVQALAEVVADMAGQRTVYGTALEHLHPDGRVHPGIAMYQASGRWSVTKPGLTVFGKRSGRVVERAVFEAAPGHVLLAADLSQIDARAVAAHSQDPNYIRVFEGGRDLHSEVAARLWGGPALGNPARNRAKPMSHGFPYGMQAEKLAATAGVSRSDAESFHEFMRESFPQMLSWMDYVRELAKATGQLDNGFGRLMRCNPRRAFTQGPALMGQGTARDLMMECLLRIDDLDPRVTRMLRIQVHDEIVLEVPEADVDSVINEVLRPAMTYQWAPPGASLPITVEVDISGYGRRWADCYGK